VRKSILTAFLSNARQNKQAIFSTVPQSAALSFPPFFMQPFATVEIRTIGKTLRQMQHQKQKRVF
jgi:hypothetical protein